ncbi:MAG: AAA family ATPase [Desulfobulbaceae bacterium]|nr:AAA family ATPase [Desulfobulbaceae bacterium]
MYNSYFNLDENPFSIAPDPRFLYMSEQHREALAHLMYALKSEGGFVLLTGEVGAGKTTVCRCLLEQLPGDLNVAIVLNPKLTAEELLATVCDELGADYPIGTASIKVLVDAINRCLLDAHAVGRKTVLIIDEAQNLSAEVLEQIRLLTNLETNQHKLLQVIMLGQPELRQLLASPELLQLSQRITARYHLGPLSREEVAAYIDHRLGVAGYRKKLFGEQVVGLIYRLTGGVPRLINVLCDRALLGTYVQGQEKVTALTVKNAAREVLGNEALHGPLSPQRRTMLALTLGVITGIVLTLAWQSLTASRPIPAPPSSTTQLIGITPIITAKPTPVQPTRLPPAASRDLAYTGLLRCWNLAYQREAELCTQAADHGLACLTQPGTIDTLLQLNSPAVLELTDEQGRQFFALLTATTDKSLILSVDDHETTLNRSELEKLWLGGNYTLLWQPPPGYRQPIQASAKGATAEWLAAQIAQLSNGKPLSGEKLAKAVKKYQQNEGLPADGVAGPETIIHLNNSTAQPVPHLSRK